MFAMGLAFPAIGANRLITVDIDVLGEFSSGSPGSRGFVVISSVNDLRQLELIGESDISLRDRLIGQYVATKLQSSGSRTPARTEVYDIVLREGQTVTTLAKDTLTIALNDAGYQVIDAAHPRSAEAGRITVDIERWWSWENKSWENKGLRGFFGFSRGRFDASFTITLGGDSDAWSKFGSVSGGGYRSGNYPLYASTWVATNLRGLKGFIRNLQTRLAAESVAGANSSYEKELVDQLKNLRELRDTGVITEDEYSALTKRLVETYQNGTTE